MVRKVNIRKRSEPRYKKAPWMVEYRLAGNKRRARFFPTRREADAYKQQLYRNLNPHLASTQTTRFSLTAKAFLEARHDIAAYTRNMYAATYHRFLEICGDPPCDEITPVHLDLFIEGRFHGKDTKQRQNQKIPGNTTINKDLRHLNALFRWAVRRSYMQLNPLDRIDKLKTEKRQPKSWTPEQFKLVFDVLPEPWKLLSLLSFSGVRKGLLVSLTRSQISLADNTIKIPKQKRQPERIVPILPKAIELLNQRLSMHPDGRDKVFDDCKFSNSTWVRLCEKAGVPRLRFHELRTCVSTWLKQKGFSGDIVAKLFAHSTPTLTYQVYTDLDDLETRRKAILALPIHG